MSGTNYWDQLNPTQQAAILDGVEHNLKHLLESLPEWVPSCISLSSSTTTIHVSHDITSPRLEHALPAVQKIVVTGATIDGEPSEGMDGWYVNACLALSNGRAIQKSLGPLKTRADLISFAHIALPAAIHEQRAEAKMVGDVFMGLSITYNFA